MGFLQSIVIGSTSFLLGIVFVNQVVDIPLLYQPLTDAALENGYTYYGIWWEAPGAVKALLHVALGLPFLALIGKLHKWTESAMFFDGSSLVLQLASTILYLSVHIPSMRTFLPESTTTTSFTILPPPPPREKPATENEKSEALRVLAAGNALIALCLVGVLFMQVGQEYARRSEEKEQRLLDEAQAKIAADAKKDL